MTKHCGAKTRSGGACKAPAMENGRCRVHGGASTGAPKGNKNSVSHGIYQQYLTDEERERSAGFVLGSVDHELRLTRVRLERALAAEFKNSGKIELDEVTENDGGGATIPSETRKSKVRDYTAIIDRLTARIESLERSRKFLEVDESSEDTVVKIDAIPYE